MKVCKYACINVSKYLQGMYVHTYLRRHVHVCMYDQYVLIDVLLQGIRWHDSTSDCRGGCIACPQAVCVGWIPMMISHII